jgi:dCMP deaminase
MMQGINISNWDNRFLEHAKNIASWSKDPSTKIGAVAVKNRNVISAGYNGFPRGIEDSEVRLNVRQLKYRYVVHAEMNVIYNASFNGVSLQGSSLYVYGLPVCSTCAKGIIQVGITEVFIRTEKQIPEVWVQEWESTKEMFLEAGVEFYWQKL